MICLKAAPLACGSLKPSICALDPARFGETMRSPSFASAIALVSAAFLALAAVATAQAPNAVVFPNSGAAAAQSDFLRGMTALHNFAYAAAVRDFRAARAIDRHFALAAWGEAMAHAHFVWGDEDADGGRRVLAQWHASTGDAGMTPRERRYIDAADTLFGQGDRETRQAAFAEKMRLLHQAYPDDVEAAVFYALALIRRGPQLSEAPVARRLQAAAILEPLSELHPAHPGVLHYLIHAYDDPVHARLALPAAHAYETVAMNSPHALHMPSHIYVRLGLWDDVARANARAFAASTEPGNDADGPDLHALEWLHFAELQQGRLEEAAMSLATMRAVAAKGSDSATRAATRMSARAMFAAGALDQAQLPDSAAYLDLFLSYANAICAAGIGAGERGDTATANQAAQRIAALRRPATEANLPLWSLRLDAMAKAIEAESARRRGDVRAARALFVQAATASDAAEGDAVDADQSLPNPVKPVRELYGEALLGWGDAAAAEAQFEAVLRRNPRRPAALLGLARALAARGDANAAACRYAELATIWHGADAGLPGLAEARQMARGAVNCPL